MWAHLHYLIIFTIVRAKLSTITPLWASCKNTSMKWNVPCLLTMEVNYSALKSLAWVLLQVYLEYNIASPTLRVLKTLQSQQTPVLLIAWYIMTSLVLIYDTFLTFCEMSLAFSTLQVVIITINAEVCDGVHTCQCHLYSPPSILWNVLQ